MIQFLFRGSPLKNDGELQTETNICIFDIVQFYIQIILKNDVKKVKKQF